MRLTDILYLYRRRLRTLAVQDLLAAAGIAVGVALMFAALVANTSLTGSVRQLTSGIVGDSSLQISARGPDGFDEHLLDRVRSLDGVAAVAPILEARAVVTGPEGERPVLLVGGDPQFARLGGPLLRLFTSEALAKERAIALTAPTAMAIGARFGSPVDVTTGAGTMATPSGTVLDEAEIGSLVHSPVMLAPLAHAQELAGLPGRVTRLFVKAALGQEQAVRARVERVVDDRLDVRDARADVGVFEQAAEPTNQSTAMFSAFAALIGFLFALSAVLLTVPQRRRFLEVLKHSGHGRRVQMQVMLVDALLLGIVGSAVGLLAGDLLSRQLFGSVPGYLGFAFPVGDQRIVEPASIATAVLAGILAACIAVLSPLIEFVSRPRDRTTSGDAPASASLRTPARLAIGGALALAGSAALLAFMPNAAIVALVLLTAALLLCLPMLVHGVVVGVARVGRNGGSAVPVIASMELLSRAARTRMFALAATGAIAVFASVAIGGAHRDLQRGLDASAREIDENADVWASFPGAPNAFATTPFDVTAGTLRRIRQLPDVASVERYYGTFLDVGMRRAWVLAPASTSRAPVPPLQLESSEVARATERLRAGGWVVVSRGIAEQQGLDVGERFTLPTPLPITLRVAALSTNLGWPPGAMVLNPSDFVRAWGNTRPSALHVQARPGVPPAALAHHVRAVLDGTPVSVETMAERQRRHYAAARDGLERLTQIALLVLGAAILAMATAMGGVIWQRRPILASLKVDGFSEGELWRALLLESGILLGAGCLIGAAFGLAGQALFSRALTEITGFPVFYATSLPLAAAVFAIVVTVALLVLAVPGLLAVRVRPAPRPAR